MLGNQQAPQLNDFILSKYCQERQKTSLGTYKSIP
jgi:hypothetical protein